MCLRAVNALLSSVRPVWTYVWGTDYCYAGVLLALLRPLTRGARRGCLERCRSCFDYFLACSPDAFWTKERHNHSSWQAITPARYDEGTFATPIITPLQGRGDTTTLALPEGLYMQTRRRIGQELNPSGELGERIEDAALHSPLPHLQLARQKPIKRVHSEPSPRTVSAGTSSASHSRFRR